MVAGLASGLCVRLTRGSGLVAELLELIERDFAVTVGVHELLQLPADQCHLDRAERTGRTWLPRGDKAQQTPGWS